MGAERGVRGWYLLVSDVLEGPRRFDSLSLSASGQCRVSPCPLRLQFSQEAALKWLPMRVQTKAAKHTLAHMCHILASVRVCVSATVKKKILCVAEIAAASLAEVVDECTLFFLWCLFLVFVLQRANGKRVSNLCCCHCRCCHCICFCRWCCWCSAQHMRHYAIDFSSFFVSFYFPSLVALLHCLLLPRSASFCLSFCLSFFHFGSVNRSAKGHSTWLSLICAVRLIKQIPWQPATCQRSPKVGNKVEKRWKANWLTHTHSYTRLNRCLKWRFIQQKINWKNTHTIMANRGGSCRCSCTCPISISCLPLRLMEWAHNPECNAAMNECKLAAKTDDSQTHPHSRKGGASLSHPCILATSSIPLPTVVKQIAYTQHWPLALWSIYSGPCVGVISHRICMCISGSVTAGRDSCVFTHKKNNNSFECDRKSTQNEVDWLHMPSVSGISYFSSNNGRKWKLPPEAHI